MAPKQRQKIEIEKTHRDPLLSFNQAVTVDCSDFLGTALISDISDAGIRTKRHSPGKPAIAQKLPCAFAAGATSSLIQKECSHALASPAIRFEAQT